MTDLCALAWHDVTCPEGPECRSRALHAASDPIVTSGVLGRFEERSWELAVVHGEHRAQPDENPS